MSRGEGEQRALSSIKCQELANISVSMDGCCEDDERVSHKYVADISYKYWNETELSET